MGGTEGFEFLEADFRIDVDYEGFSLDLLRKAEFRSHKLDEGKIPFIFDEVGSHLKGSKQLFFCLSDFFLW